MSSLRSLRPRRKVAKPGRHSWRLMCAGPTSCAVGPDLFSDLSRRFPRILRRHHQSLIAPSVYITPIVRLKPRSGGEMLHDRELNSLVERAIAASPTLGIALDRLQQARAQEAVVVGGAARNGRVDRRRRLGHRRRSRARPRFANARLRRNRTGVAQVVNLVGFDAAWELDIFGKYRRGIEAAQYDVDVAVAARNLVLISVGCRRRSCYLDLRALQMQLAVLRKDIQVAQKYVDFVRGTLSRGITNELDVTLPSSSEPWRNCKRRLPR